MRLTIEFNGPYDEAYDLVDEFRAAGASVVWEPPDRERGDLWYDITLNIIATGAVTVITETLRSFLSRHKRSSARVQPSADEDPSAADPSD